MPALPDFGTEQSDSSKLPDFGEALPDFGEPSPVQAPDLSKIKLSPYDQATEDRGGIKPPSGMESGTELTEAVASDPIGFAKSIPSIVGGAMMAPGKLAYAGAADLVAGATGDTGYGGNLASMQRGEDQLPAEKLIGSAAQASPKLAVGANIAKSIAEMAPMMGMTALPASINRIAAGVFSAQMIAGVKASATELGAELGKPEDEQDAGKIASLKSDLIQTGIFAPMAGAGAVGGLIKPRAEFQGPLATGELLKTPQGSAVPPKVPFELPNAARAPEPPVVPTAPPARTPMTQEEHASVYPVIKSDALVDGREQLNPDRVPNMSSIESSIDNPQILPGIREVPMSDFTLTGKHYSVEGQKKIDALAESIKDSGKISPLIVVRDSEGAYILEGATRADALFKLGAKSFPAKVVLDIGDIEKTKAPVVPPKAEAPPVAPVVEAGTANPHDLVPALKPNEGEIIPGQKGNTHGDIYKAQGEIPGLELKVSQPEHGFLYNGEFKTRREAADLLGLKDDLHSEVLNELQKATPERPAAPEYVKGGAESGLSPEAQAKSRANNSLRKMAEANGVEFVEGDTPKTVLAKINAKSSQRPSAAPPAPSAAPVSPARKIQGFHGTLVENLESGKLLPEKGAKDDLQAVFFGTTESEAMGHAVRYDDASNSYKRGQLIRANINARNMLTVTAKQWKKGDYNSAGHDVIKIEKGTEDDPSWLRWAFSEDTYAVLDANAIEVTGIKKLKGGGEDWGKQTPPAPAADRWTKLYAAEHADLLDAQRRMEEARQYQDADAEKQAKQERDDILQRLAEFDKLSKRPGIDYFSPPKDLESMTIMLLRDNPRLTLAEAAADAQERIAVQPEHEVVPPSEDFPRAKSVVKESSTTEKPFVDEIRKVINNPNNTRPERNFAPGVSGDQNAYTHTTRFTSGSQSYVAYLRPEKHNTGARSIFNHPAQLDVYHATDTNMARPLARIDLSEISKATIEETSKPIPPPAAAPVAPIEPSADLLDIKRERGIWRATWKDPSPQSGVFFHEVKSSKFPTLESAKTEFSRQIELAKQRRLTAAAAEAAPAVAPRQARTAPSGMTGVGGAVPSEFGGNESFVSNMFAAIDRDRAEMGKPPMGDTRPHTWDEANQKALAMMNQNPNWIPDLLDKMEKNPRPLSQEENAAVVWHRAKLKAEYNNSLQRIALAFDDNRTEDLTAAKVDAAVFEDKLARLDGIVGRNGTGSEAGRRLQALKMGAGDDFTLVEMTLQKRAAVGGRRLTPEETSSIQKDVDRLNSLNAALEKSLADADAKASSAEAARTVAELKASLPSFDQRVLKAAENIVVKMEGRAVDASARLREKLMRMSAGVDPTILYDASVIGSARIARLGLDLANFTDSMVRDFGEKIRPLIGDIWQKSNEMLEANLARAPEPIRRVVKKTGAQDVRKEVAAKVKSNVDAGDMSKVTWQVQKLARELVKSGITDREALIDAVHDALKDVIPGITRRGTMDAISGYGDFKRLSKDRISLTLRGMKGEMQQLAKLEDMAGGKPPLKTGIERREATPEERRLIKEVNDAKNKFQVPIDNPETQLKSALDTLKATIKNRIADFEDRLARKDYAPRPRREVQLDTEATRLRAEAERIKKRWRESLLADRMKNRTTWEKALDWGTKFRRFTALSSPAVIPKLLGAAGWRAVSTLTEDVSGRALSLIPGIRQISQRAPLEGYGGQLSATMRGFGAAFTQGLKDAAQVARTGHSDIDVLYGKASESYTGESEMASVLLGLPGRLHGTIKAPVKRGMFEKATQRLGEFYARQGLDVTSDPVKYRIALEAYKAGNRSIFLQDNRVASGFNAALQALEKKGETGHPSPGGKVLATVARFMFPVTRVPTNIAAETLQYTTGSVTGSARAINAIRKGLDTLTPDQADLIMRELKKGSIGMAALYLGYMGYQSVGGVYEQGKKRKPGDVKPDAVRVFGEDIPGNLLHAPVFNAIQLGSTVHRTAEDKLRRKDADVQGITAGVMAASWGLAEEVPFIQGPSRLFQGLKSPYTRQQTVGNEVGSIAIPQAVTWLAQVLDERRETPPTNFYQRVTGPPARLKPANVLESLKTRIPGLRQQVPLNPKGAPTAAPAAAVPPWEQFH